MRKFLFLERPRPSPETARTAGSCDSAVGHMTPAVSPAPRPSVVPVPKIRPKAVQKPSVGQGLCPVPREGTQPLTGRYTGGFGGQSHRLLAWKRQWRNPRGRTPETAVYFCLLLLGEGTLLLREIAPLFITEKEHHRIFIHGVIMTFVVPVDDVPLCFHGAPGGEHRGVLDETVKHLHQHCLHLPFSPARPGALLPSAAPVPGRPPGTAARSTG